MELKDTLVTGATVLAVGTSSVVGGNQVMDKVNKGPEGMEHPYCFLFEKQRQKIWLWSEFGD